MRTNFLTFIQSKTERENNKTRLLESFNSKNVDKVLELIDSILIKHIDGLVPLDGFVETEIDGKECTSKQYIVIPKKQYKNCSLFQLNWLNEKDYVDVYSIDFFRNMDVFWSGKGKADLSIYTLGTSIVKLLPIIWKVVKDKNYKLTEKDTETIVAKGFDDVTESVYDADGIQYTILRGLKKRIIQDSLIGEGKNDMEEAIAKYNSIVKRIRGEEHQTHQDMVEKIKVAIENGKTVKVKDDKVTNKLEQAANSSRKDPEQVFKEMSKYITLVLKGLQPSLILCGAPGVGKTYRVKKQLKAHNYKEGENLCTIKGKCTARKLYLSLYEFREKNDIVLIDDADSLVGPKADENCINILKAALDSSSDPEGRLVTYGVAGKLTDDDGNDIPKKCYVKSGVIVITNYRAGSLDTALRNRSFIQDIDFTNEDVLHIIEKLLPDIEPELLDAKSKVKSYDYLCELNEKGSEMELSLRTFVLCAKIFKACDGDTEFTDDDAKSMIEEQMRLQYARARGEKY